MAREISKPLMLLGVREIPNATNARSRADAVFGLLRTPAECYRSR